MLSGLVGRLVWQVRKWAAGLNRRVCPDLWLPVAQQSQLPLFISSCCLSYNHRHRCQHGAQQ